jgi:hypothetical protein
MTDTNFRGPVNSIGAMEDATVSPTDGPNYNYQGTAFQNLRGGNFQKDGVGPGRIPAYLDNPSIVFVDNIPSSTSTTAIATAVAFASGTPITTLITVAPGNTTAGSPSHAPGMPIIPFGASTPVTVTALDFGFTTGTTVAASSAVTVVDNTLFTLGQWIAIGGAGNSAKTASLLTQVVAISTVTTLINIFPLALGSLSNAPIGGANLFAQGFLPPATQFGPSNPVANAEANALAGGLFRLFNPLGGLARNVSITATTAIASGTVTIRGYDVHGQAMSETLTTLLSTATIWGRKAFKYIASVTPNYTDSTGTYSVGVGDVFGLPFRMDRYEYLQYCWNGINNVNQTGFVAAVQTVPTATTGDVRGTLQVGPGGTGTAITNSATANGTARLWILQTMPLWNDISGTPTNTVPFFGQTQFTN